MAHETYYGLPATTWIFIAFAVAFSGLLGGLSAVRDHLRRRRALRRWQEEAIADRTGEHGRPGRSAGQ